MKLLTQAHQNAKTAKNEKFDKYLSAILHLAPYNLSGVNVCPAASRGCAMACLNTAGRGRFDNVQQARIRKTKMYIQQQAEFLKLLAKDITALERKAKKLNKIPVVRLNGTSDIDWENVPIGDKKNVFELFPNVQFYDYSKRVARFKASELPNNYHMTFSRSEVNDVVAKRILALGFNVAVVFQKLPEYWHGYPVISGDEHDLRFLDPKGYVIGLTAKGKAKKDNTGFVVVAA